MNSNEVNSVDTLLILGNGFDLRCLLKSKFSDFFETGCLEAFKKFNYEYQYFSIGDLKKLLKENGEKFNYWSFLFYINYYIEDSVDIIVKQDENNWFNIEKLILESLNKKSGSSFFLDKYIKDGVDAVKDSNFLFDNYNAKTYNRYSIFPIIQEIANIQPREYLFNELRKFENSFKDYLKRIINEKYKQNSKSLLSALLSNYNNVDIINFNYTNVDDCNKVHKQFNVHGSLEDDEIIIGIDTLATEDDLNNSIFTKTYRNLHRLKEKLELPKNIDHLVFYGHSLAEADFSYFYSLFDMYHLYDSKLDLTFYYSDYEENDENNKKNHSNYVKNVYNLINKYSTTSKGETNLLHRLLLEGRIIISKLDDTNINYLDPSEG